MKTTLIIYAIYFFACLGFGSKPTAEGIFLPFLVALALGNYSAIKSDKEVNTYLTTDRVDTINEAREEIEKWMN